MSFNLVRLTAVITKKLIQTVIISMSIVVVKDQEELFIGFVISIQ